jgi:hypothetical protein
MSVASSDFSSASPAGHHNFRPERSITPDPKTASRDPATVRASHPGVWSLWLALMRLPQSSRAEVPGLFRRPRKLQNSQ